MITANKIPIMKRIVFALLICTSFSLFLNGRAARADWQTPIMSDYSKVPPFISREIPPNVIIAMDISGSMKAEDFQPKNRLDAAKAVAGNFRYAGSHLCRHHYTFQRELGGSVDWASKVALYFFSEVVFDNKLLPIGHQEPGKGLFEGASPCGVT